MSNIKYILGHFADPDDMMHGIDKLQENNISVYDVFTPMPIHGIEDKLGIRRSRLGKVAFGFGITGTITAISMITYMLVIDWPMNIGGKPHFAFPDFVPIMFELTVLFAAFGMVGTYFFVNHLATFLCNVLQFHFCLSYCKNKSYLQRTSWISYMK